MSPRLTKEQLESIATVYRQYEKDNPEAATASATVQAKCVSKQVHHLVQADSELEWDQGVSALWVGGVG